MEPCPQSQWESPVSVKQPCQMWLLDLNWITCWGCKTKVKRWVSSKREDTLSSQWAPLSSFALSNTPVVDLVYYNSTVSITFTSLASQHWLVFYLVLKWTHCMCVCVEIIQCADIDCAHTFRSQNTVSSFFPNLSLSYCLEIGYLTEPEGPHLD